MPENTRYVEVHCVYCGRESQLRLGDASRYVCLGCGQVNMLATPRPLPATFFAGPPKSTFYPLDDSL